METCQVQLGSYHVASLEEDRSEILLSIRKDRTSSLQFSFSNFPSAPIRKIYLYLDRLKFSPAERLTGVEPSQFDRIINATQRMSTLIDDLLYYSEVSLKPDTFEDVDMHEVVALVLDDLDAEIAEKKAKVVTEKLFTVKGQHRQLQQAFPNLIGNALKYSRHDIPPEIHIGFPKVTAGTIHTPKQSNSKSSDYFILKVKDNGIGFDQKHADKIFNVFTRLHNDDAYTGIGVGLTIVRKVIENHNGFIEAESKPGEGSCSRFTCPQMAVKVQTQLLSHRLYSKSSIKLPEGSTNNICLPAGAVTTSFRNSAP